MYKHIFNYNFNLQTICKQSSNHSQTIHLFIYIYISVQENHITDFWRFPEFYTFGMKEERFNIFGLLSILPHSVFNIWRSWYHELWQSHANFMFLRFCGIFSHVSIPRYYSSFENEFLLSYLGRCHLSVKLFLHFRLT